MLWLFLINMSFLLPSGHLMTGRDQVTVERPQLRAIKVVDDNHAWVAGYRGVFYTDNGGKTWQHQSVPVGTLYGRLKSPMDIHKGMIVWANAHSAIIRGENGLVLARANSREVKQFPIPKQFRDYMAAITFSDRTHGWGIGTLGQVYRTIDGGMTWNINSEPVSTRLNAIVALPGQLWIVGDEGTLLHTTDEGKSWDKQVLPQNEKNSTDLASIFFIDSHQGWVGGLDGLIFHTTDAGRHWEKQSLPISQDTEILDISFASSEEGWAIGAHNINGKVEPLLFYTSNGGLDWHNQTTDLKTPLSSLQALSNGRALVVGWDGSISQTLDQGNTWFPMKIHNRVRATRRN